MNLIEDAQTTLLDVEKAASNVGLHLNAKKTEVMIFNQPSQDITSRTGEKIKVVQDFKYLGSYVNDSLKDINCKIAPSLGRLQQT